MSKDIYIYGTCRVCYPEHDNIKFVRELRKHHSRYYITDDDIDIYTEPVNYTTKLTDVLDSIYYMKGKLYNNLDPKNNTSLQSIFFRGHEKEFISPSTHPNKDKSTIQFRKVIIEIFSIKQYIINTYKYGNDFYLQNLPWKIHTGYEHNGIIFDKNDFIIKHLTKDECFDILDKIAKEVECDIMIIGPYISKKVPDYVNNERIYTQNILKEYCNLNKSCYYFDISSKIDKYDIEIDEAHFNRHGIQILSNEMYNFIMK